MKKGKWIILVLLVLLIAAVGAEYYFVYMPKVSAAEESQEIVLEEGQEFLYAKITSISGNEMDYTVLAERTIDRDAIGNGRGRNGNDQNAGGRPMNGERPSGDRRPDFSENMPPDGETLSESVQNGTMTIYTETGETGQIQIPVGTDVETKLGTITTFSRLSNGDTIKMLLQKTDAGSKELLKIWIIE